MRCLSIFRRVLTNSSLMRMFFYERKLNEQLKNGFFDSFIEEEFDDSSTGKEFDEIKNAVCLDVRSYTTYRLPNCAIFPSLISNQKKSEV